MFWAIRRDNPDVEWIVLVISASILWEKECAFCKENAASANVTCIPIGDRKGLNAFNSIYEEFPQKPSRIELGIPPKFPTNPQAEVLVFDTIEPDYILGGYCETRTRSAELRERYPDYKFKKKTWPFSYRQDWGHWRRTSGE